MDPDQAIELVREFERQFPLEFKTVMLLVANRHQSYQIEKLNGVIGEKNLRIVDLENAMKGEQ